MKFEPLDLSWIGRMESDKKRVKNEIKEMVSDMCSQIAEPRRVTIERGESYFESLVVVNSGKYDLKDWYQDYTFNRGVFQHKIPDYSCMGGFIIAGIDSPGLVFTFDVLP